MILRAIQLVHRAVAPLFDKHCVLPTLAWAVVIRDGANLIGRSGVPRLLLRQRWKNVEYGT